MNSIADVSLPLQVQRCNQLLAFVDRANSTGVITREEVIALEKDFPKVITKDIPLYCFDSQDQRGVATVTTENIFGLVVAAIVAAVIAIINFIIRLFKGKKSNGNYKDTVSKTIVEVKEKIDKHEEAAKTLDSIFSTLTTFDWEEIDKTEKITDKVFLYLTKIGVEEKEAKKLTNNNYAIFSTLKLQGGIHQHTLNYASENTRPVIMVSEDSASLQSNLKALTSGIRTEVTNRANALDKLYAFCAGLTDSLVSTDRLDPDAMVTPPSFAGDLVPVKTFLDTMNQKRENRTAIELLTDLRECLKGLFANKEGYVNLNYPKAFLEKSYTDNFINAVVDCNAYIDEYNKVSIKKLELLEAKVSAISSVLKRGSGDKELQEQTRTYVDSVLKALKEEVEITSRISVIMIYIKEEGDRFELACETMYKRLETAINFLNDITKKINGKTIKLPYNPRRTIVSNASDNELPLSGGEIDVTDEVAKVSTLFQMKEQIENEETIDRNTAREIEAVAPGTIPETVALESFTFIPTKINVKVTLEGIMDKIKEIVLNIIKKVKEAITRFINWLTSLFGKKDKEKEKIYGTPSGTKKYLTGIHDIINEDVRKTFDLIANACISTDQGKVFYGRVIMDTYAGTSKNMLLGGGFSGGESKIRDMLSVDMNVVGHFDKLFMYTFAYGAYPSVCANNAVLGNESGLVRFGLDGLAEVERRLSVLASNVESALISAKNNEVKELPSDEEQHRQFLERTVQNLELPNNIFRATSIVGGDSNSSYSNIEESSIDLSLLKTRFNEKFIPLKGDTENWLTLQQFKQYVDSDKVAELVSKNVSVLPDKINELKNIKENIEVVEKLIKDGKLTVTQEVTNNINALLKSTVSTIVLTEVVTAAGVRSSEPSVYGNQTKAFFQSFFNNVYFEVKRDNSSIFNQEQSKKIKESLEETLKKLNPFILPV